MKKMTLLLGILVLVFGMVLTGCFSLFGDGSSGGSSGCSSYGTCWVTFNWYPSRGEWERTIGPALCSRSNCDVNRIIAGGSMGPEGTFRCDCGH